MTEPTAPYVPGLEGVVAARTALSHVDGEQGILVIGGFPVEELAAQARFEEVLFLLWEGRLPTSLEHEEFRRSLAAKRELPAAAFRLLESAAGLEPLDALLLTLPTLRLSAQGSTREQALSAVASLPLLIAAHDRIRRGLAPLESRSELGHAENFLYLLDGKIPTPARARGLETYLNTVVDHGLNASTFAARVIISTRTDLISALVGALGALKGPLHGGAPGPALELVFEIGKLASEPVQARKIIEQKLRRGERLMGFGHRIYRTRDPRADVLAAECGRFYSAGGELTFYENAIQIEKLALQILAEHKPDRVLQTNVEYYTALLLHGLGLCPELFTPVFAMSRIGGWCAHAEEQLRSNRLIRPSSEYIGPRRAALPPAR